jgi:predicted Co/Zn/Cd cation transporter (cation efflux family)
LKDRQVKIDENLRVLRVKELRLDEQVRRDIEKSEQDILLQDGELRVVELQLQATIEALVEIEKEIEMLKVQKLQEIKRTIAQMYKAKNYDSQKVRI